MRVYFLVFFERLCWNIWGSIQNANLLCGGIQAYIFSILYLVNVKLLYRHFSTIVIMSGSLTTTFTTRLSCRGHLPKEVQNWFVSQYIRNPNSNNSMASNSVASQWNRIGLNDPTKYTPVKGVSGIGGQQGKACKLVRWSYINLCRPIIKSQIKRKTGKGLENLIRYVSLSSCSQNCFNVSKKIIVGCCKVDFNIFISY